MFCSVCIPFLQLFPLTQNPSFSIRGITAVCAILYTKSIRLSFHEDFVSLSWKREHFSVLLSSWIKISPSGGTRGLTVDRCWAFCQQLSAYLSRLSPTLGGTAYTVRQKADDIYILQIVHYSIQVSDCKCRVLKNGSLHDISKMSILWYFSNLLKKRNCAEGIDSYVLRSSLYRV